MSDLLDHTVRPPVEALAAEPLSVAEIDAHPDSARIWATILNIRETCSGIYDEGFQDGLREAGDRE